MSEHRPDSAASEQKNPREISFEEAHDLLKSDPPPQLIDVREPEELAAFGWINGARHIPMNSIPEQIGELDSQRPLLLYCASGARSFDVGCYLIQQGFSEVFNLADGINGWNGELTRE